MLPMKPSGQICNFVLQNYMILVNNEQMFIIFVIRSMLPTFL